MLKSSGDSIRGYIKTDVDSKLAKGIQFKKSLSDSQYEFLTVDDIKSFGFDDGNTYTAISYFDAIDSVSRKVFGKFLIEGMYNLYSIPRNEAYCFYITSVTDTGHFVYDDIIEGTSIRKKGNFRNILNFISRNCEQIHHRIINVAFTESMMIDFIKDLNACLGDSKTAVHYKKHKNEAHFLIYGGGMSIQRNTTLTFQGQMRIMNPGISKKGSIVIGIAYSYVSDYQFSVIEQEESDFITQIISIPVCFQYNFTATKFQPLLYLGFSAAFADADYPDPVTKKGLQQNFGIALVAGIGMEYYPIKNLGIKADWRYELIMHTPTIGVVYKIK